MTGRYERVRRVCASRYCGEEYVSNTAYCSQSCRNKEWRAINKPSPRISPHRCINPPCHNYIVNRRSTYCGPNCRASHWFYSNHDRAIARNRAAYAANRESHLARHREYHIENAEVIRARATAWRIANPDRRNEHRRARRARERGTNAKPMTRQAIAARFDYFGNKCWMCGGPAEAVDHVKPIARGGSHIPSNIRPACTPCNSRKNAWWEGVARLHELKRVAP